MSPSSPSLLSSTERHAFNAFLTSAAAAAAASVSAVDPALPVSLPIQGMEPPSSDVALAAEWQMYTHFGLPMSLSHPESSAALAKATKDLIALHPPRIQQQQQQLQLQEVPQPSHHEQHQPQQPASSSQLQILQQQQHRHIAPAPSSGYALFSHPHSPSPAKRARMTPPPISAHGTPSPPPPHHVHHVHGHGQGHGHHSMTPTPTPTPTPVSSSAASVHTHTPATGKATLLSAQQKKANHIQSEQKRRANIRRGYEALCDTVPALREAIRAEEEASANGVLVGGARRKRARVEDGEKIDGRAGPRSESVVLQKTIEYIQVLLTEKATLMSRLERARSMLGTGHPAQYSHMYPAGKAPWEREWDGGKGLMTDVEGDHESSDE